MAVSKINMRTVAAVLMILLGITASSGQKRVADLHPSHAAALRSFLSKNKNHRFLSENVIGADHLKDMRKYFKGHTPYYNVGDFNRDGINDFAVILSRDGSRKDNGDGMAETHRYDYPLTIVIFNGSRKGRYRPAFIENVTAPLVCFLNTEIVKKKKQLYFGIFETDDIRILSPAGKGYVVKYPPES